MTFVTSSDITEGKYDQKPHFGLSTFRLDFIKPKYSHDRTTLRFSEKYARKFAQIAHLNN